MNLRVTLLGTGTSHGVPMIGCECRVCRSTDPHDRRSRPSILIELTGGRAQTPSKVRDAVRSILVDTSTDLRTQALTHGVVRVDAILFTHSHADHIMGLDEVRRYNILQREALACFADSRTVGDIQRTFAYVFNPSEAGGGIPQIVLRPIGGPFSLGGAEIIPVPVMHGRRPILGFRMGTFAYLTDCSAIPDQSWPLLEGVRTLVLDALRDRPHPTHFSVAESLQVVARLSPAHTYFTHICHDLPHDETCRRLPPGVQLAYDGLVLEIPDPGWT